MPAASWAHTWPAGRLGLTRHEWRGTSASTGTPAPGSSPSGTRTNRGHRSAPAAAQICGAPCSQWCPREAPEPGAGAGGRVLGEGAGEWELGEGAGAR